MDGSEAPRPAATARPVRRLAWRERGGAVAGERMLPEETPIAFAFHGASYAVMLATPADLEDFALGFSLTEGLVAAAEEIEAIEVAPMPEGIVLHVTLAPARAAGFWARRRFLAGPSGCGLCGIESLAQALRPLPRVASTVTLRGDAVGAAMAAMMAWQRLHRETQAVHAAGFWHPRHGVRLVREDVGRHNALDKLAGALAAAGIAAGDGAILLTSRVSVEMVQKAAMIGAPVLIAVSAPTTLAVRLADEAGITLAAVARADGFEIFTHARRLIVD